MFDPTIGRWFEEDPAGLDIDPNLYEYVGNAPVTATDPSGRQPPKSDPKDPKWDLILPGGRDPVAIPGPGKSDPPAGSLENRFLASIRVNLSQAIQHDDLQIMRTRDGREAPAINGQYKNDSYKVRFKYDKAYSGQFTVDNPSGRTVSTNRGLYVHLSASVDAPNGVFREIHLLQLARHVAVSDEGKIAPYRALDTVTTHKYILAASGWTKDKDAKTYDGWFIDTVTNGNPLGTQLPYLTEGQYKKPQDGTFVGLPGSGKEPARILDCPSLPWSREKPRPNLGIQLTTLAIGRPAKDGEKDVMLGWMQWGFWLDSKGKINWFKEEVGSKPPAFLDAAINRYNNIIHDYYKATGETINYARLIDIENAE